MNNCRKELQVILRAKTTNDVIVFELEGHLDFESTQQFEQRCSELMIKAGPSKIVFNMEKLRFVGSSGINQFIKVMKDFNAKPDKPRLCHLSSEFQKIFVAYQTSRNPFQIHESENEAVSSFSALPEIDAPKKTKKKVKKTRLS